MRIGWGFWLPIKSVSNTLSCCCFVCAFIIGQYHSGNNMSSKSGAAGAIFIFESESATEFEPWKWTHSQWVLSMLSFMTNQESKYYLSHQFVQEISLYTVHIKSIITKFCFRSQRLRNVPWWNVSWPASIDTLAKTWLSLLLKHYPSHCGTSLHQEPRFYFTAKCLGSF